MKGLKTMKNSEAILEIIEIYDELTIKDKISLSSFAADLALQKPLPSPEQD